MKKKSTYYLDSGKVREAILRSGVSKEQIVERSGFGFTTLNNMQNPRYCAGQAFSMRTILAVSAAIGCKAADLLADGTNTPAPAPKPAQRAKPKQSDLFEDPAKEEAINRLVQSWQESLPAMARSRLELLTAIRDTVDGLTKLYSAIMATLQAEGKL